MTTAAPTLVDLIWDEHVIVSDGGLDLLHIDRSLLTDLSGTIGLEEITAAGRAVRDPALHLAVPDHVITTGDDPVPVAMSARRDRFVNTLASLAGAATIEHLDRASGEQGIVHVTGLERGFSLPGATVACGDSHTSTHGAVGALAWGIGSTEVAHVLATQTLWMRRPFNARIMLSGQLSDASSAKDVALWLIGHLGADFGAEHAVEFAGTWIAAASIEARATVCNLAVELGARFGIVAPDDVTFHAVAASSHGPSGRMLDDAIAAWRRLHSHESAAFDTEVSADVATITPQITWGTTLDQVVPVSGAVPLAAPDPALDYMGLRPGMAMTDVTIDHVFIGSCANGRVSDLRAAADQVRGRSVAAGVRALVVPGSQTVRRAAEREGLDRVFRDAGFEWRQPGCSMCVGVNGDVVPPGGRCVSTSNRNFIGRQGPGARTHLASPATAAASAIAGRIAEPQP